MMEVVAPSPGLASEWDALADRAGARPFARPGWVEAWCAAFRPPGRLEVVTLRAGRRLRALVPLTRRGAVSAAPSNAHTPAFGLVAEDGAAAADLAAAILSQRRRRVSLWPVEQGSTSLAALRDAADGAGWRSVERTLLRSPYLEIPAGTASGEALLGRSVRSDLRRRRRRLEESGRVEVQVEEGAGDVAARLAEGIAVEARQWKGTAGTAIASRADTRAFYAGVARWAAGRGILALSLLRLDGRAIAFELDLLDDDALYVLKRGFDPAHSRSAPGHLLGLAALDRGVARGITSYELLGDAEPWKLERTATVREMRRLDLSAPSPAGLASHLGAACGRPAVRRLRRYGHGLCALGRARGRGAVAAGRS